MLFKILLRLLSAFLLSLSALACMLYIVWCNTVSHADSGNAMAWAVCLCIVGVCLMPRPEDIAALVAWAEDRRRKVSAV